MASPGEVRTRNQEYGLMLARLLIFAVVPLLVACVGLLINLPGGIAGALAGLVGFGIIAGCSMFEVKPVVCPRCGRNANVVKNIGSFECPECGQAMYVYGGEVKAIEG